MRDFTMSVCLLFAGAVVTDRRFCVRLVGGHENDDQKQNLLRPVKDNLGLRTPGVYKIPCECGKCYIGQTGRTIMERCKKHQSCMRLYYPDKSAVAQHSLETGHKIDFSATSILDKTSGYWDLVIKEAIEIQLDGNNFNRDGVYS
ncbi:hypothetical protein ANN_25608 [Periplaneta americana]|uniref:GIY-YIG domain-containing protein n=1 Tax=Periplaneta americana TaxID=6978 RepID=A0ABQ8S1H5_PERAM|nr:hypothetical protein ANN_25608 [Periplaneta americana]